MVDDFKSGSEKLMEACYDDSHYGIRLYPSLDAICLGITDVGKQ